MYAPYFWVISDLIGNAIEGHEMAASFAMLVVFGGLASAAIAAIALHDEHNMVSGETVPQVSDEEPSLSPSAGFDEPEPESDPELDAESNPTLSCACEATPEVMAGMQEAPIKQELDCDTNPQASSFPTRFAPND